MTGAGWLLIIGALLFNIAAFHPFIMRYIPTRNPDMRTAMIERSPWVWRGLCALFAAGAVVTVVGLLLLTLDLGVWWLWIGLAAAVAGAYFWVRVNLYRVFASPRAVGRSTNSTHGWFPAYTLLTQAAWVVFGAALLTTTLPAWLGWGLIGVSAGSFVMYVVTRDFPPFVYYLLMLVVGGVLLG